MVNIGIGNVCVPSEFLFSTFCCNYVYNRIYFKLFTFHRAFFGQSQGLFSTMLYPLNCSICILFVNFVMLRVKSGLSQTNNDKTANRKGMHGRNCTF